MPHSPAIEHSRVILPRSCGFFSTQLTVACVPAFVNGHEIPSTVSSAHVYGTSDETPRRDPRQSVAGVSQTPVAEQVTFMTPSCLPGGQGTSMVSPKMADSTGMPSMVAAGQPTCSA